MRNKERSLKKAIFRKISKKERTYFILFNFACYVMIFCLLGLSAALMISSVIMSGAKDEILAVEKLLDERSSRGVGLDARIINDVNRRMTIELYDENDTLVANIGTFGIEKNTASLTFNEFSMITACYYSEGDPDSPETIEEVYLLVYPTLVDWNYKTGGNQMTAQTFHITKAYFYMDVNSEIEIRNRVVNLYISSIIAILALAFVATFFISRVAMQPIAEAFQKQTDFVSDASHELRTPLAILQSKLENILSHSDSTVLEVSDDLAISLNEVIRLSKLTNNLLTLSRSDRETIELDLQETNLSQLVKMTAEPFVEMAAMNTKTLTLDCEDVIGNIDKDKISQVLVILLDNSLRYTDENDQINVKLTKVKDNAIINVTDTGMGISDEAKQHMFDRFYREDKARSKATGGRGLGLAIAKALVNICGGKIYADHNLPKGTVITIELPLNSGKIIKQIDN